MAWYQKCPIRGCQAKGMPSFIQTHSEVPHHKCPGCGWVGISPTKHLGQVRRRGLEHPDTNPEIFVRTKAMKRVANPHL